MFRGSRHWCKEATNTLPYTGIACQYFKKRTMCRATAFTWMECRFYLPNQRPYGSLPKSWLKYALCRLTVQAVFFSAYWRISAFLRWFLSPWPPKMRPKHHRFGPIKSISAPRTYCQNTPCSAILIWTIQWFSYGCPNVGAGILPLWESVRWHLFLPPSCFLMFDDVNRIMIP